MVDDTKGPIPQASELEAPLVTPTIPVLEAGSGAGDAISAATEGPAIVGPWEIFISYRIKPDEQIAESFRDLLVATISPVPRVFVASSGGLRPSETGYKRQIQKAAQETRAFVAIITPASIEREWLFFEAGAAWGREQMYAPLLIDTEPSQLPSTIADYQATRATRDKEVEQLVTSIAESLGRKTRRNFSARYKTFRRALDETRNPELQRSPADSPSGAFQARLHQAIEASRSGDLVAASETFEELRELALDLDQRALLELIAVTNMHRPKNDPSAELIAIEKFSEPLRSSPRVLYSLSFRDPSPSRQVEYLERALAGLEEGHPVHVMTVERLITRYVNVGRQVDSEGLTKRFLADGGREAKSAAARTWAQIHPEAAPALRLLLFCWSHALRATAEALRAALMLTVDTGWKALSIYLGRQLREYDNTFDAQFQLGRAYCEAGLASLGYDSYALAAEAGVAVAKLNMAGLVGRTAIPMAALKMMDAHSGEWNCSPSSFPYEFRARMTEAVSDEEKRADHLNAIGETQFAMLVELAELKAPTWVSVPDVGEMDRLLLLTATAEPGVIDVAEAVGDESSPRYRLTAQPLVEGLYEVSATGASRLGMARASESFIRFVWFDVDGSSFPSRSDLTFVRSAPPRPTIEDDTTKRSSGRGSDEKLDSSKESDSHVT